jgi:hypothetical protein
MKEEKCVRNFGREYLSGRYHWEDLCIVRTMLLNWMGKHRIGVRMSSPGSR